MAALTDLGTNLNDAVKGSGSDPAALSKGLYTAISTWLSSHVLPVLTGAMIAVTLVFVFYGAFQYFTAYGDENKAAKAKMTLTYAIIGLIIASLAFGIASYAQRVLIRSDVQTGNMNAATDSNPTGSNPLNNTFGN